MLLLVLLLTYDFSGRRTQAQITVCTAADVIASDPGCPSSAGPCTISQNLSVTDGCTLDFGTRAVTVTGTLNIGSGCVDLYAGSLTIAPGALINGRAPQSGGDGGMICIQTDGDVTVQKAAAAGRIDVGGADAGGTISIMAGGSVHVAGGLIADNANSADGNGGSIQVCAGGSITTAAGSLLSVRSGTQSVGGGGSVDLTAGGDILLGDLVNANGSCGGMVQVCAGGAVALDSVEADATGDGDDGGTVDAMAGTRAQVFADVAANGSVASDNFGSGSGGAVCIAANYGDLALEPGAAIAAEGASPDGGGGTVTLMSQGTISVYSGASGASISTSGDGAQGCGGTMCLQPNIALNNDGIMDASGGAAGGEIDITAGTNVVLANRLLVNGQSTGSSGGTANITAGSIASGALTIFGTVDVGGGGCDQTQCGSGGSTCLEGCNLTVTSAAAVRADAPSAGENDLTAREQLTITGAVTATATTNGGTDGLNFFEYPLRKPPLLGTGVQPPAQLAGMATCPAPGACLAPCPVCGNGVVEYGETCDDGNTKGCDGCSAFCQLENCNDGNPCTTDLCDPLLGCRHLPVTVPCTEPPTPEATATSSPSATPIVTPATATPTAAPSPTDTPSPTPAPPASATPSATPTPSATTPAPPSPTPMPTPSPTAAPTGPPGDANCDGSVSAADLPALVQLLARTPAVLRCGADATGDGRLDAQDLSATLRLLFEPATGLTRSSVGTRPPPRGACRRRVGCSMRRSQ